MEITGNHGTWFVVTGLPQIPGVSVPRTGFWEMRRPEATHPQERCAATLQNENRAPRGPTPAHAAQDLLGLGGWQRWRKCNRAGYSAVRGSVGRKHQVSRHPEARAG